MPNRTLNDERDTHLRKMLSWKKSVVAVLPLACIACGGPNPDSTKEMTSMPTGNWVGQSNPDVSLDIQNGGYIKLTVGAQETVGNWEMEGKNSIKVILRGQSYTMPFERKDLSLKVTLPGESAPSEFEQM